jgi:hypothetical protein
MLNVQCPPRLLYECDVRAMRKQLKLFLTVVTLVSRNVNYAIVAPIIGSGEVCV